MGGGGERKEALAEEEEGGGAGEFWRSGGRRLPRRQREATAEFLDARRSLRILLGTSQSETEEKRKRLLCRRTVRGALSVTVASHPGLWRAGSAPLHLSRLSEA